MMRHPRRQRRGSYSMLLGFLLPINLGFAALAVDTSWIQMSQSQSQDVADAASHAALIDLRRTGDTVSAEIAAKNIIDRNIIGGDNGTLGLIEFGNWDRSTNVFDTSAVRPNAVRVQVGRYDDNPVQLKFARIWDKNTATVSADAISATRSLHAIIVFDITGSFWREIDEGAKAAVAFLDIVEETHGEDDMVGLATYTNRFGNEWTPMFFLRDRAQYETERARWGTINVASKVTGSDPYDFSDGGRFPQMPREYSDEPGTDHHVGLVMATQMILEQDDPFAFRAFVLLTDGDPNTLGGLYDGIGRRQIVGYTEERWREYRGPIPHTRSEIIAAARTVSDTAWDDHKIHQWVVSFRASHAYLRDMVHGEGQFYYTDNATELVPIFEEIAGSLPLLIVR